jgi:MFS family permease
MNVAMHKEEQAILWAELERVPELYREPLILYYREHRSVEHVAVALDLTEDTVKQRLARGRKILQERVLAFVEGALERSTPGRVFTVSVLAALPAMLPAPVKAAAIGVGAAAAAHGSALGKATAVAAALASFTGVATTLMALRANLDQSRTPRERRAVVITTIGCFFGSLAFIFVLWSLRQAAFTWWDHRLIFAIVCQVLVVGFVVAWPFFIGRLLRWFRQLRTAERRDRPELFRDARDQVGSSHGEYRSRRTLLGVPLVHFRFCSPEEGDRPVFGWIAGGDRAFGLLFAWGGWAVAPISVGLFPVGLLSVGAVSVGVIGLGTFAVGGLALGCVAIGVKAYAWLSALGWLTAGSGGFGLAWLAALAPVAFAQHANDPVARQIFDDPHAQQTQMILLSLIVLLAIVPMTYYMREVRRRLGRQTRTEFDGA